jgi:hypothetical protein
VERGTGSLERRRERRSAGWLGLAAFLAYLPLAHGHFTGTDEMGVYLTARALYETGGFEVRAGPHRFQGRDGRTYAHFAPALPLLLVPLYALGDGAEHTLPEPWLRALAGRPPEADRIDALGSPGTFAVALYPPLASSVLVALFFLLERRLGASVRSALLAAALLGATSYVATHSVYLLRHTTEALTLLGGFLGLVVFRAEGQGRALLAASALASLTLLVAVPATVALPPLAAYGLFVAWPRLRTAAAPERARLVACALLPALAVLALHVAHNHALWGTVLDSPMVAQRRGFTTPLHLGLAGFLLSPGASVFLYSPLLLLLVRTLPGFWRERRAECLTLLAMSLALLLFCSGFGLWHGLFSAPGPRYLFALTPLLCLPLGPWLDHAVPRERRALLVLAGVGLAVQLALVLSRWSAVIREMGYLEAALRSDFGFLFVPGQSPIVGSARAVAEGHIDVWLVGLATGFDGGTGAPLAAALLLALWALALGFALSRLRRAAHD